MVLRVEVPVTERVLVAMKEPVIERPRRVVDASDAVVVAERTPMVAVLASEVEA